MQLYTPTCSFMAYWTSPPPGRTRPSGSASAIAGTVFGWVLWVTEHQQWQTLELAWSQLLRVIQTYFGACVFWLSIRCFCLLMNHSQRAATIPQTQLWKWALKAGSLEFAVIIQQILASLRVGYQPWCLLLFISFSMNVEMRRHLCNCRQ